MPAYINSPFQVPKLLQKGVPVYLFGSFDYKIGNTYLALSNVVATGGTGTVTVQLINGPNPVVGGFISIVNSTTSSGLFNVNRAVITAVSINQATGAGTIAFALTGTVASTADSGSVLVEPPEIGETLVAEASIPCLVQAPEGDSQFTLPIAVTFPTMPTAVSVHLQVAIRNNNAEYTNVNSNPEVVVAASAFTSGPVAQVTLQRGYFYRFITSGLTGSGTIVAKIG